MPMFSTDPTPRAPTIVCLFDASRPAHIAGLVTAVIVDALDRVLRGRLRPDVPEERVEVARPRFGDANPARAIAMKVVVVWVRAPLNQVPPGPILGAMRAGMRKRSEPAREMF